MDAVTLTLNPCVDRTLWVEALGDSPDEICLQSGGKGVNVARVLGNLGVSHLALAPAGGETGRLFERLARSEGINLQTLSIRDETRTVDTYVRRRDLMQRVEVGVAPRMTPEEIDALEAMAQAALTGARVFCLCGSACCPEAAALGARMIEKARAAGIPTLLDSNGPALKLGAAARPDLVKPNERELAELLGETAGAVSAAPEAAARRLLEQGVGQVLVSLGEKGALWVTRDITRFCPAPRVEAKNPVGAGDSFVAGLLYGLLSGRSDAGALALACAAGAACARVFPAARVTRAEIEEILGYKI